MRMIHKAAIQIAILFTSSYVYAVPVTVQFSGTLGNDASSEYKAPGAPDILKGNSTITGQFTYDTSSISYDRNHTASFSGSNLTVGINGEYAFGAPSVAIATVPGGASDYLVIKSTLTETSHTGLASPLVFQMELQPVTGRFDYSSLFNVWDTSLFTPTSMNDVPGISLTGARGTYFAFNVDRLSGSAEVPELPTLVMVIVGAILLSVQFARKRLAAHNK